MNSGKLAIATRCLKKESNVTGLSKTNKTDIGVQKTVVQIQQVKYPKTLRPSNSNPDDPPN